jgi:serine/threonine-protein kinase
MLKPGMFISDRYEIIDKVGSGGMADVYKARDQRLNRFVAIKVLKPEYSSDKSFVNKFRGEAQSAAGLSHPNIVNVYDVGDDSGLHYIVMELVEGITLKRFIERKGKLEVKEAVGIAIQIAQGMEAAHDNHIIHRDIKPQNIIISRDGKVKVTDFGIAKATNSNTITSNAMGSVHYLSPEQARGGYSDEKSDIYSLGVTMYEMLSGKVPFAGDNTVSVALLHIQGEAMPLRELDPEIPVSIDKIVQKCMQKRPERRYHTASELITDLKKAITNPDGDFVQIPAFAPSDSPTINIGDDINKIKNGAYLDDDMRATKNLTPGAILEDEEEEELDTVDSKVEKVFLVGTIVAAVILGIVIIALVAWFLVNKVGKDNDTGAVPTQSASEESPTPSVTGIPTDSAIDGEMYTVPDVVGQTQEDAEAAFKSLDQDVFFQNTEDYSDDYEAGYVIKQYPPAGNSRQKGTSVILTISIGKKNFEVPNVYGLTESQADIKLEEKNLVITHEYEDNSDIPAGEVIRTEPERETMVTAGTEVKVIISKGVENTKVSVPNLLGLTEADAETSLTGLGLVKGNVTYDTSDTFAEGQVCGQSYSADLQVDKGTKIDITISSGSGSGDGSSTNVQYIGSVTIDANPLADYEEGETVEIILEVQQPGHDAESIFEGPLSAEDFPYTVPDIVGYSTDSGTVTMYVDGELYPQTWTAQFVEQPLP